MSDKTGIELIAEERQRQIDAEGWTPEHDAQHIVGELAFAACYYALPSMPYRSLCEHTGENCTTLPDDMFRATEWDWKWAKRNKMSRLRRLQVAGALIAAEIDRVLATGEQPGAEEAIDAH